MSTHTEHLDANHTTARAVLSYDSFVSLVLTQDDQVVITGTRDTVASLIDNILDALELEPDTSSSASRQHYIDTGRYLFAPELTHHTH